MMTIDSYGADGQNAIDVKTGDEICLKESRVGYFTIRENKNVCEKD